MAILIPADGSKQASTVKPKNRKDFRLPQLYELLSCSLIEIIPLREGLIMVLDEESKLTGKPRNERATRAANFVSPKQFVVDLLHAQEAGENVIWMGDPVTDSTTEVDYIAGDALICEDYEVQ